MFVNSLQFGYFVLFGLLQVSIGNTLVEETGSDVTLVIEFVRYPWSCNKIRIILEQLRCVLLGNMRHRDDDVMTFTNNGVQCLSIIGNKYETRIFNVSINFPTYVTFGLRNISFFDSGWYHAIVERHFYRKLSFGNRTLLVHDIILKTCTLKQMEFEFVLPLSVFNETVAVLLCSGIHVSENVISICNPEAGTCVPPSRATFPRFQCTMNGSRITITLTSVQMEDEGIYALIGSTSSIIYQSAVINVIECVSSTPAFDVELNTTELPNLTTKNAAFNNNGFSYSKAIISSAAPITDQSFVNYFVGGGVVAGTAIVILTCWFLWKRCCGIRGNGASVDDYNTVDVHYYCSIRNQNQCVTESEATTGSVPESHQLSAVMEETKVRNNTTFESIFIYKRKYVQMFSIDSNGISFFH